MSGFIPENLYHKGKRRLFTEVKKAFAKNKVNLAKNPHNPFVLQIPVQTF